MEDWFLIKDVEHLDTPALVVYKHRVEQNIRSMIDMVASTDCLRPHVKTCKSIEAVELMMVAGITKFKCATIAEAEMLAMAAAPDVLLAYQPNPAKLERLFALIKKYPATHFSCLADNQHSAKLMSDGAVCAKVDLTLYIDINVGMNRTGIQPGPAVVQLYEDCMQRPAIHIAGLHVYDGHIRYVDFAAKTALCNQAFGAVEGLLDQLKQKGHSPAIVAGGSPTFSVHARRRDVECSPGTFIYWDDGYSQLCPEQPFVPAALVIGRVISSPTDNTICIDIGHKSVASENELQKRIRFLNAPGLVFKGHSEEHLVAEVPTGLVLKTGDILYGLPHHICPTVALYERAMLVEDNRVTTEWKTIARDRKLTV